MAELSEIERIVGEAERATSAGDHAAAERALRRVLRLQEAGLGLSHPDVANTLNDLAVVCDRLGRPDEAEFLYRRALGIARRSLEPGHPYIVRSLEHLSNLYRAQGKPEKLEKIREGRSPGSGLPELGLTDEAGDGAVDPEEMGRPETSATPAPVSAVQSERAQRPQENRLHPIFAATSHPAVLMAGAAVVLISVLWLLLGGNADPVVPGRDGAGTRLEASGGEPRTGVVDPAPMPAPGGSETVEAPARAVTASESGTPPSEPEPGDGAASTSVPPSDGLTTSISDTSPEPPDGPPDSPPPSAVATSSVVAAAEICSQLDTQTAQGTPLAAWHCQPVGDSAAPGRFFFYTRIRSRTSTTVEHRWLRDGVLEQQVALDIGANDGPGYRTYSRQTVSPAGRGRWRVELRLGEQELHVQEFVVP